MAVLKYRSTDGTFRPLSSAQPAPLTEHGLLTGLDADDHPQYKEYTDEVVTVSVDPPSGTPSRDGLLWVKVNA